MHGPALDAALFVHDALEHGEFFLMGRSDERERPGDRKNHIDIVRIGRHRGRRRKETQTRGRDDGYYSAKKHRKRPFTSPGVPGDGLFMPRFGNALRRSNVRMKDFVAPDQSGGMLTVNVSPTPGILYKPP